MVFFQELRGLARGTIIVCCISVKKTCLHNIKLYKKKVCKLQKGLELRFRESNPKTFRQVNFDKPPGFDENFLIETVLAKPPNRKNDLSKKIGLKFSKKKMMEKKQKTPSFAGGSH